MNPYHEMLLSHVYNPSRRFNLDFYNARYIGIAKYGFAVPSDQAIEAIKEFIGDDCAVELGAGLGYWASLLQQRGAQVSPYDLHPPGKRSKNRYEFRGNKPHTAIKRGSYEMLSNNKYWNALILIWPDYNTSMAYETIKRFTGNKFIYVGEGKGGCTADDAFHDYVHEHWDLANHISIPSWPGIHDRLCLYKKL